jgi:(E)-4-hydroxy-3-methylbut-2-enyl-diphosphate synthase
VSGQEALRPRRRPTVSVDVGGVLVGSAHPIVVHSMTNTDTADADATAIQVARLAHAGSQLVRVTVNTEKLPRAVPEMVRKVRGPWVWTSRHRRLPTYNGHKLLADYRRPRRPWPSTGSTGQRRRQAHDEHFATIVKDRHRQREAVRIGVNWGSLTRRS